MGVLSSKQGSSREEKDCSFYSVNTLLILDWLRENLGRKDEAIRLCDWLSERVRKKIFMVGYWFRSFIFILRVCRSFTKDLRLDWSSMAWIVKVRNAAKITSKSL